MHGGADSELIEFIEADPSAFGPTPQPPRPRSPRLTRPRPRWITPAAVATLMVLAVGATVAVWKPWENHFQIQVAFPSAPHVEPTLTEQLVFGDPPANLSTASDGIGDASYSNLGFDSGYVFAADGATFGFGQGGVGRWAALLTSSDPEAQSLGENPGAQDVTIQGVPGQILVSVDSQNIQADFGLIDGKVITVITSELSQPDTLSFAESARFVDGIPVVTDARDLLNLRPVTDISSFGEVYEMVLTAAQPSGPATNVVSVQYGPDDNRFAVTSLPVDTDDLGVLRFFLGGDVTATVHGRPALTLVTDPSAALLAFGSNFGTVVAWVEGGRLVMVTGRLPLDELLTLAESVRPATNDEWTEVTRIAANTAADFSP